MHTEDTAQTLTLPVLKQPDVFCVSPGNAWHDASQLPPYHPPLPPLPHTPPPYSLLPFKVPKPCIPCQALNMHFHSYDWFPSFAPTLYIVLVPGHDLAAENLPELHLSLVCLRSISSLRLSCAPRSPCQKQYLSGTCWNQGFTLSFCCPQRHPTQAQPPCTIKMSTEGSTTIKLVYALYFSESKKGSHPHL